MIGLNEYFGGQIKSLGAEYRGQAFTTGIMMPGEYKVDTSKEESITVSLGEMTLRLPEAAWQNLKQGQTTVIPAGITFELKIKEPVAYVCLYK